MLQLAWVTNSQEFEIRAYLGLARQLFYEQNVQKSQFYLSKALCSELEPPHSRQRLMAIEQFRKYIFSNEDKAVDKWVRLGYKVDCEGFDRVVDSTQEYDEAFALIRRFSAPDYERNLAHKTMASRFLQISAHRIGRRVVKVFPPCNIGQENEV